MKPLVSIKCLAFNQEPYIRKCLQGFVMQKTTFDFEVIVHDDASTDGTSKIIQEFANDYPDIIKPIYESENQYSKKDGSLFKIVNEACSGKYIATCEGDDYWTDPYKLQKQVEYMEANPEIGLSYTDYSICDHKFNIIQESCFALGKHRSLDFKDHLINQGYIAPMSWMYRNDVSKSIEVSQMFIDGTFAKALEFYYHSKVGYINQNTCVHIVHENSACHQVDPVKKFGYEYDVLKEQLYFANKYAPDLISQISFSRYMEMMPDAILVNNMMFLNDAEAFFSDLGIDYCAIRKNAEYILSLKEDAKRARNSKSYKLGAALLKPIRFINSIFK